MDKLRPKQEKAITALLVHPTIGEAAQAAGVSERTLQYWLVDNAFKEAYTTARREAARHAIMRVFGGAEQAAQTLVDLLSSSRDTVRLQAARTLLELTFKSLELDDILQRIEAIEKAQQQ